MLRARLARIAAAAVASAVVAVGLVAAPAQAEASVRTVSGHVWLGDSERSAVAGEVTVSATKVGGSTYTAATDANGDYSLPITFLGAENRALLMFTYNGADGFNSGIYPNYPIGAYSGTRQITISADRPHTDMTLPAPVTVSGRVLLAPTYAPAGAGTVKVSWERMNTQDTGFGPESAQLPVDADGRYSFTLPGGYYYFRYVYSGDDGEYEEIPFTSPGTNSPFVVFADDIAIPDRTLYPKHSISGTVRLGQYSSAPLAGAGAVSVTLSTRASYGAPWSVVPGISATTDKAGRYTLTDVPTGTYAINVAPIGEQAGRYDTASNMLSINLYAWDTAEVATEIALSRLGSISGRILLDDSAHPAQPGTVVVEAGSQAYEVSFRGAVTVDSDGRFTISNLPESSYWLVRARFTGDAGYADGWAYNLNVGSTDATGVTITLVHKAGFRGTITDAHGNPVSGTEVEVLQQGKDGEVATSATVKTDASGAYRIAGLAAGWYSLRVDDDRYAVQTWPDNGEFFYPGFFSLTATQFATGKNLTLHASAMITGSVSSTSITPPGFAAGEVGAELLVKDGLGRWVSTGYWEEAATDGTFTMDRLPPDLYRVRAAYLGGLGESSVLTTAFPLADDEVHSVTATVRPFLRDLDGDLAGDLLTRNKTGQLVAYRGDGAGRFAGTTVLGSTSWANYTAVVHAGDFDSDGKADVIARQSSGVLVLWRGNGAGGLLGSVVLSSSTSWKTKSLYGTGDFDGDGHADLLARSSNGYLYLYPGDGAGHLLPAVRLATGFSSYLISNASDFDQDGRPDFVARDKSGVLYLYRNNGAGGLLPRLKLATGWQKYNAITSVGDFDGDWIPDLIVRDTSGYLWLVPGDGNGGFFAREKIGSSGWKYFKLAT